MAALVALDLLAHRALAGAAPRPLARPAGMHHARDAGEGGGVGDPLGEALGSARAADHLGGVARATPWLPGARHNWGLCSGPWPGSARPVGSSSSPFYT